MCVCVGGGGRGSLPWRLVSAVAVQLPSCYVNPPSLDLSEHRHTSSYYITNYRVTLHLALLLKHLGQAALSLPSAIE